VSRRYRRTPAWYLCAMALATCGDGGLVRVRVSIAGLGSIPSVPRASSTVALTLCFARDADAGLTQPTDRDPAAEGGRCPRTTDERRQLYWLPGRDPFTFDVLVSTLAVTGVRVEASVPIDCLRGVAGRLVVAAGTQQFPAGAASPIPLTVTVAPVSVMQCPP